MTVLDATGLFALEEVAKQLHATKRTLILCGAREQPSRLIQQAEFANLIGNENICENVQEALRRAEEVYDGLEATAPPPRGLDFLLFSRECFGLL
jgi:SulP family sulfate permease